MTAIKRNRAILLFFLAVFIFSQMPSSNIPSRKVTLPVLAIIAGSLLIGIIGFSAFSNYSLLSATDASDKVTVKAADFKMAMRDLWIDHIVWTRQYIVSFAADLPDQSLAAERLLQNQQDIGDAIKPYYGEEDGDQLAGLLEQHILIAVDLLNAAKEGDADAVADAEERWYNNAHDIAVFLSTANPNLSEQELEEMLDKHLELTEAEAVARLNGDYAADRNAFDQIHDQALEMADVLADGIIAQFPKQFK
jgi:hypothetical protein